MNSGVYIIKNLLNGKVYIGSAISLRTREQQHFGGRQSNRHLQSAMNKYGKDSFIFRILEHCRKEALLGLEQFYIDLYKDTVGWKNMYNISPTAGSNLGVTATEETKRKLSEAHKGEKCHWFGKYFSGEHRARLKAARNKRGSCSQETRLRMSLACKGRTRTEEHQKNLSRANKGKHRSVEARARMSAAQRGEKHYMFGKHHSDETKAKISEAKKGEKHYMFGKHHTEETRQKISDALKRRNKK